MTHQGNKPCHAPRPHPQRRTQRTFQTVPMEPVRCENKAIAIQKETRWLTSTIHHHHIATHTSLEWDSPRKWGLRLPRRHHEKEWSSSVAVTVTQQSGRPGRKGECTSLACTSRRCLAGAHTSAVDETAAATQLISGSRTRNQTRRSPRLAGDEWSEHLPDGVAAANG
jgi:hypothetical protein